MVPKKFGDWMSRHAGFGRDRLFQRGQIDAPVVAEADLVDRHTLVAGVGAHHLAILRMHAARHQRRAASGEAHGHHQASAEAVEPSYMEALATSMPVSSQIIVWNSKIDCSVPCAISG